MPDDPTDDELDAWLKTAHHELCAAIARAVDLDAGLRAIIGPENQDQSCDESAGRTDTDK